MRDFAASINFAAPLSTAPVNALLASHLSACSFTYNTAVVAQRDGLVTMSLSVTGTLATSTERTA